MAVCRKNSLFPVHHMEAAPLVLGREKYLAADGFLAVAADATAADEVEDAAGGGCCCARWWPLPIPFLALLATVGG
jgi:hypothetical protein